MLGSILLLVADLILLFSDKKYKQETLLEVRDLANKIALNNQKRVSIGYSYINDYLLKDEIVLMSMKDNIIYQDVLKVSTDINPVSLALIVGNEHSKLENQVYRR